MTVRLLALVALVPLIASSGWGADVSSPRHAVIAADKDRLVTFDKTGNVVWQLDDVGPVHRIQPLDNGNILTQDGWTKLIEVTPDKESSGPTMQRHKTELTVEPSKSMPLGGLPNGRTMVVENGNGRIIEIDRDGTIQHQLPYQVSKLNPHRDVRQAHKLPDGNYLLCHEMDGRVVEYAPDGEIVWSYDVPLFDKPRADGHGAEAWGNQVFNALRLPNGNTLISTGNGHSVIEVTPDKEIVWSVHQHDLDGITLAWTTSLEVLPNGNIVIGNCHAGPNNPQLIEVTRDKQVVWTFHDFDLLGDSTAASATLGSESVLR